MPNPPKPTVPEVRKGQDDMQIPHEVFRARFRARFYDPAFERADADVDKLMGKVRELRGGKRFDEDSWRIRGRSSQAEA